jgi:hypothetical protein
MLYLNFKLSNQKAHFVAREHEINHALRHQLASLRSFCIRVDHARQHARQQDGRQNKSKDE